MSSQSLVRAMPGAHSSADWLSRSCAEAVETTRLGLAETRRPRALEVNQWPEEKSDRYAHLAVNDASEVPNESATVVSDASDRSSNIPYVLRTSASGTIDSSKGQNRWHREGDDIRAAIRPCDAGGGLDPVEPLSEAEDWGKHVREGLREGYLRRIRRKYAGACCTRAASAKVTPDQLEEKKTNDLVASFLEFMDLVKDEPKRDARQTDWIRNRFREDDLQIPSQPKIAENIIHFLVERRLFEGAVAVYQYIIEDGLLPSPSTDALFLAVAMKASKTPNQLEGFKTILSYRSFTETHFMELLDHIVNLDIGADNAVQLTRLFISVKGKDYRPSRSLIMKLIGLQTQAGQIEAAADTIMEYDQSQGFDTPAEPYAQMIHSAPASDQEAVDWIMGVMREKDVPVHVMVFNSLIARQKHTPDLRKAFAFYNVIIRLAATTALKPDAITYKHLFRLLGYQYKTNYHRNASRNNKRVAPITPPRQLFADMILLWFSAKFHPPASELASVRRNQFETDQSLLTIAFRAFLYLDDYPAALVVLRTITDVGLRITERTYFILLRYMTRKVYYDVYVARAKSKTPVLALGLLGPFDHRHIDQDADAAYRWIMHRLLAHNREGQEQTSSESRRGRIPTVSEILKQDLTLSGDTLDFFPLVTILSRALQIRASASEIAWGEQWQKRTMTKARYDMIPKDVELWTWTQKEK
ncbi:hypothetical protein GGX14DRAFT_389438 [Mycena pura]|uniref:Uncharacterized protein n=1 Tax=Mycena pura TaxID=153505 RepID=A0AAD6YG97_9AGAR|nr:hypothetical protein GGX14DRAFT_389438 [Mycena pura]